ncbi:MAG: AI-2E family transporter [Armatimonadetes bacterium]|nr:AI-2E family transporter [Armatimonadota bacterium]
MRKKNGGHEEGHGQVLFWLILGCVLLAVVLVFWPFLSSLLWAAVLAVLMFPLYKRLCGRFSQNFSALVATAVTALVIVLPFATLGTVVGVQVYTFANSLVAERSTTDGKVTVDQLGDKAQDALRPVLVQIGVADFNVKEYVERHRDEITEFARGPLTMGARKLVSSILILVMAIITMFFMLRDGPRLLDPVCEIVPLPPDETKRILLNMQSTIQAVFIGVVLVSLIQGAIATLAYWVLGVQAPLVWGVVTVVFCTIPLLGAPVVYVPLAARLMIEGNVLQGIILLGIGFGVISVVDNLLRPIFIGARSSLHPIAIFFALLGGVVLLGPVGIMAGPTLLALLLGLIDILRANRRLQASEQEA